MKHIIKAIAYYSDGGDGSGTFSVYNNIDELQKDMDFDDETMELIKSGDDPYENGEIDEVSIVIEEVDGKFKLATDFYLHWGQ